jgi:signal transduction histidine kinase
MAYVALFNFLTIFIFSKLLWTLQVTPDGMFTSETFLLIYLFAAGVLVFLVMYKSPADMRRKRQEQEVENERQQRQNLEFVVASKKLKQDLLTQANLVKDELQLLEGAWRSNIHDIINDLPTVKERELYEQIVLPFQENIIEHLRRLDEQLSFDLEPVPLSDLCRYLTSHMDHDRKTSALKKNATVTDKGWHDSDALVEVDRNKVWGMLLNVLRNSQTAMDLPRLSLDFELEGDWAVIRVTDNGGGAPLEKIDSLYRQPVPSSKRGRGRTGQGTLFVKFFADRMGVDIEAENTDELGGPGLKVTMAFPVIEQNAAKEER